MYFSVPITIPKKRISYDWSDAILLAESEHQPFTNTKIVSTKSEYRNIINAQAIDIVIAKYPDWRYRDNKRAENFLRKTERELLKKCDAVVYESVEVVVDGSIKIVVNCEDVSSDESVNLALNLFSMYRGDGEKITFGKPIKFNPQTFSHEDVGNGDSYPC